MKKSMLGWFGLAGYQVGGLRDGSDEKTWFRMFFGVSDVWTGMFMIVLAYNGSMPPSLALAWACVLATTVF